MRFEDLASKLIGLRVWILGRHRLKANSRIDTDRTIRHSFVEEGEALIELLKDRLEKFVRVLWGAEVSVVMVMPCQPLLGRDQDM
ncbi:hypothetical protein WS48_32565 [Burkholderia sp. RF7-non_BP1]|nr:hypothetical protein WS45_17445 [Burkholderia sp. RF2-non_BP3]KUY70941.1 hypothetical protein WS46_31060 [Burkholderia sp. RF4-BP95]KUZ03829.1 hypothetical protein WS48_32565 [Burkholderia sp. RF7-non_BP1]KUZ05033.1 hypothetical protein WS49_07025 [Burkholderia sp. RF7-non_BP4]